ncbi:MAG: carbohydrate ABC transporter substrate-binding protein, partial [Pseudomonadota bacterium]
EEMDITMARMQAADEAANVYGGCGPRLNEEKEADFWLNQPGAPKAKLANEKPKGKTVKYEDIVQRWAQ